MAAAFLATALPAQASEQTPPDRPPLATTPALSAYGNLPGVEDVAISPTGMHIAVIGRLNGQRQLIVMDAAHKPLLAIPASDAKIRDLRWIGDEAVMLTTSVTETLDTIFYANKAEISGVLVVPLDGSKPWMVFERDPHMAKSIYGDFGTRQIDGKWQGYFRGIEFPRTSVSQGIIGSIDVLMAVDFKDRSSRRVARFDSANYWRTWLLDAAGTPAVRFEISGASGQWNIQSQAGVKLASGIDPTGDVNLCCFGPGGASAIYSTEDEKSGETKYFEVPLAGGLPVEYLPGVVFDRMFIDPVSSRLLGYSTSDKPQRPIFFDPAQQATIRKVYKAFGSLHVELRDWTPDFRHILVRTSGNGDSGSWYTVDMTRLAADPVGIERPLLLPALVGPISTFQYKAADGLDLDGILTLPPGRSGRNLPVIILPHGGPAGQDNPEFDWWAQAFASRGYAVFQPNFRGSTNRDGAFMRAGYGQWGRKMQTDLSDGLAELARQGIVDPKRACIMGASYGGYAALAGVTLQQGLYRCVVAVAPVSDLGDLYARRTYESGHSKMTWKSMRESYGDPAGFDAVSPRKHATQADAPILLIHGKDDTVVPFSHSQSMADALKAAGKPHELMVMQNEDHWLSRSATRQQMLEAAMRFVQQHNPAD